MTVKAAVLTGLMTLASAEEAAVRLTGLSSEYCTNTELISGTLENLISANLLVSLSVDKQLETGEWEEYVLDVFADEPFPRKVTAITLTDKESRAIEWRPPDWAPRDRFANGEYRLVAFVRGSDRASGRSYPVGQFSVSKEACFQSAKTTTSVPK